MAVKFSRFALIGSLAASLAAVGSSPTVASPGGVSVAEGLSAGQLDVPVNKSQVIRADRPYSRALIGNPEIADVLPLTSSSLYVLGKKPGTTSLTLYDRANQLIAVMDVVVGPDVIGLRRQLSELIPGSNVGARISNASVVLEGTVSSADAADKAVQIADTYAPGKVVNMLSLGSAQQVMLEVRFSEVKRSALKQIGVGLGVNGRGSFQGVVGNGASLTEGAPITVSSGGVTTTLPGANVLKLGAIADSFGIFGRTIRLFGGSLSATLDALEQKGSLTTLAEPNLVALSGQTASFLAGGEFPIPVAQGGGTGTAGGNVAISVQFKPFGVSLAFTPTVLADGVINLVVAPEVSSIDPTASVVINGLRIPGLQTRRAQTTVELRDGESFAMAGLLRSDFQSTVRQLPLLGSLPIIGALFRSNGFNREETELVIVVTPRLVRPVRADALRLPTDTARPPDEVDQFLLGRTDTGTGPFMGPAVGPRTAPLPPSPPPAAAPAATGASGVAAKSPSGFEKEYGHVL